MLRELKREHLYEAVAGEIKRYITENGLKPGDSLPSERELCRRLNVGRTSLREGLRELQMLGLIEIKSGLGAFVHQEDVDSFLARGIEPLTMGTHSLDELIEIRESLEVVAARLAARRATPEQIQGLQAKLDSDKLKVERGIYSVEDDIAFHRLIFEAAGNSILVRFVSLVAELMASYRGPGVKGTGSDAQTVAGHLAMFETIRAGRAASAARLMREHVQDLARAIREARGERTEESAAGAMPE